MPFSLTTHTIILSLAGQVPTVRVALDDYYLHKNEGALMLFEQEDCIVCTSVENVREETIEKIRATWARRDEMRNVIGDALDNLRPQRGEAIRWWLTSVGRAPPAEGAQRP